MLYSKWLENKIQESRFRYWFSKTFASWLDNDCANVQTPTAFTIGRRSTTFFQYRTKAQRGVPARFFHLFSLFSLFSHFSHFLGPSWPSLVPPSVPPDVLLFLGTYTRPPPLMRSEEGRDKVRDVERDLFVMNFTGNKAVPLLDNFQHTILGLHAIQPHIS